MAYAPNYSDFAHVIQLYDRQWDHFPTFGAIFAYDSKELGELAKSMNSSCADKPPHERVDLVCILKHGCIVNRVLADGTIDMCPSSRTEYRAVVTDNPLMLTTVFLQEVFSAAWSRPIKLVEYLKEVSYGHFMHSG